MRRILPRAPLTRRLARVNINNTSRAGVSQSQFRHSRANSVAFLCDHRRFELRQRKRIASLIRGRHAAKNRLRPSQLEPSNVHRNSFLVTRRLALGWLFQSTSRVSHRRDVIAPKQMVPRRADRRVFSHATLTNGWCVHIDLRRFMSHVLCLRRH